MKGVRWLVAAVAAGLFVLLALLMVENERVSVPSQAVPSLVGEESPTSLARTSADKSRDLGARSLAVIVRDLSDESRVPGISFLVGSSDSEVPLRYVADARGSLRLPKSITSIALAPGNDAWTLPVGQQTASEIWVHRMVRIDGTISVSPPLPGRDLRRVEIRADIPAGSVASGGLSWLTAHGVELSHSVAAADKQGRFHALLPRVKSLQLVAVGPGLRKATMPVPLESEQCSIAMILRPLVVVRGQYLDPDGNPIPSAQLQTYSEFTIRQDQVNVAELKARGTAFTVRGSADGNALVTLIGSSLS